MTNDAHVELTQHFEIHVPDTGFARSRSALIGAEVEVLRSALRDSIGLDESELPSQIKVFLGELLPESESDEPRESWIVAEQAEVWAVYRPDSPGVGLSASLVRLLLRLAIGIDLAASPAVLNGLTSLCENQGRSSVWDA